MDVTIKIEKRYAFGIMGILVLLCGIVAVEAFGGNDPLVMGHSVGEIDDIDSSVLDGVSWDEISGIPDGLADGVNIESYDCSICLQLYSYELGYSGWTCTPYASDGGGMSPLVQQPFSGWGHEVTGARMRMDCK